MDNSIKIFPQYWDMIINMHNEGYKNVEYSKEVAEANVKFLKRLKTDDNKTQVIQITSKGYLRACLNDNNELVPFNINNYENNRSR